MEGPSFLMVMPRNRTIYILGSMSTLLQISVESLPRYSMVGNISGNFKR